MEKKFLRCRDSEPRISEADHGVVIFCKIITLPNEKVRLIEISTGGAKRPKIGRKL